MTSAIVLHSGEGEQAERALIDAFRASVEHRCAPLREAVSCVAHLLDRLVEQVVAERRSEMARVMIEAAGLEPPPTLGTSKEILGEIRVAVDQLGDAVHPAGARATARPAEHVRPAPVVEPALQRQVDQLDTRWKSIQPDSLSDAELRLNLQLIAAGARRLQHLVPDGSPPSLTLATIVRNITRLQRERKPGFVLGLRRTDDLDWAALEAKAAADLEHFRRDTEAGVTPRPSARVSERASRPERTIIQEDPALDPLRTRIAESGPLVIVGGQPDPQKVFLIRGLLGATPEWVETTDGKTRPVQALCERVIGGRVAGVIVLFGLMSHSADRLLAEACKRSATPVVRIDKPGTAQIERALAALASAFSPSAD